MYRSLHALTLILLIASFHQVQADRDVPAPISFSTNVQTNWDGNDGPWNTFNLQIGEQKQLGQIVRVLPAFHHGHLVVVARDGCPDGQLPRNCSQHRGGVFDYKTAVWWDMNTIMVGNQASPFQPNHALGRMNSTVLITGDSPVKLLNQNVILTQSMDPFVGVVGLSQEDRTLVPGQSTFLSSALKSLDGAVKSFSYTAGVAAMKTPGSLLLGGYDGSRFENETLNYSLNNDPEGLKRFTVKLNAIRVAQLANSKSIYLNSSKFVIDPVTPYMWLPAETMAQLEKVMGLKYDATNQLYLSNSTRVSNLSFVLSNSSSSSSDQYGSQNIHLGAETLILNAAYPLYNGTINNTNSIQYLPFKRGPFPENGAYTLGRAFFQSVHIIANYDVGGFRLAQARYQPTESRRPIGLLPNSLGPNVGSYAGPPVGAPATPSGKPSTPVVEYYGLVVGVLCAVVGLAVCISIYGCCAYRKATWPFKSRRDLNEDGDLVRMAKEEEEEDGDLLRTAKAELDGKGLSLHSSEISQISEMPASEIPCEIRGSPIVKAELDGDMPWYELDARPRSIDWGSKDADPSVIVRRLLAR